MTEYVPSQDPALLKRYGLRQADLSHRDDSDAAVIIKKWAALESSPTIVLCTPDVQWADEMLLYAAYCVMDIQRIRPAYINGADLLADMIMNPTRYAEADNDSKSIYLIVGWLAEEESMARSVITPSQIAAVSALFRYRWGRGMRQVVSILEWPAVDMRFGTVFRKQLESNSLILTGGEQIERSSCAAAKGVRDRTNDLLI